MLLDGFQATKLQNHSTTPIIFINLNLPPELRYSNDNILLSCLIPGPSNYKNLDSFMHPIIQELLQLEGGVEDVLNAYTPDEPFTLRATVLVVSGDGPASADAIGMKKPGAAKRPCHHCMIRGEMSGTTYYIPHSPAHFAGGLTLRTQLRDVIYHWQQCSAKGERDQWGKDLGISRASSLLALKNLSFPNSFPLDLMHCVLINIMKQMHGLFGGRINSKDQRASNSKRTHNMAFDDQLPQPTYQLPKAFWVNISRVQKSSRSSIPAALGQAPRPIDTRYRGYKAMEWREFLCRDGVTLLYQATAQNLEFTPYLEHFVLLRKIYLTATSWSILPGDLRTLRSDCITFVRDWERYYYNNDPARLLNCKINVHSLLHLADHIEDLGPATAWWAIPMERYIGVLKGMVSLMSNIDMDLANRSIIMEHLNHIAGDHKPLHEPATKPPPFNATYPRPPKDKRSQYTNLMPKEWRTLLRRRFADSQRMYPIETRNKSVRFFGKYHIRFRCLVGSQVGQATAAFNSRDDSFIWWWRSGRRRYGRVVVFAHCWDWEPVAIVRPYRAVVEESYGRTCVDGGFAAMETILLPEIGGLVGRLFVTEGSAKKTYLVGEWQ